MTALLDTGFILALLDEDDALHVSCQRALNVEDNPLVPFVVLPELAYMVIRNLGYDPLVAFLRSVVKDEPPLIASTTADLERASDILQQYEDSKIDFVDCVLVAMAERLNISRILTVDQRDFRMIRPSHIPAFEILP